MTHSTDPGAVSILSGDYALEVLPQLGGALAGLRFRGREVLREKPAKVDVQLWQRFPEFNEFKERSRASQNSIRDTLTEDAAWLWPPRHVRSHTSR